MDRAVSHLDSNISYLDSKSWDDSILDHMRWLRENDPVRWSEPDDLWLISKFEDVSYVSKHQEIFTSAEGVRPRIPNRIGLLDEGEPHHGHLRHLINRGFTPRMVKKLESTFREIVTESLDAVAKRGECDFVTDIAVPLPLLLIAEMLGIHKQDRERFHRWSDDMIAADGRFDDPSLIPSAVEEMVRMVSPVHSFGRTLTRDTELRGRKLRKGQRVLLLYPSANRDADVFEDPDVFRVERNPHHLGFGMGSHFCLGANLARMELRAAFEDLLRRLPDMEYAGDGPEIVPAALVRSCVHMQVRFTPET